MHARRLTGFAFALRNARVGAGVSLRTLADALEISASYLSDVETDRRGPLGRSLVKRCERILGVPSGALVAKAEAEVSWRAVSEWRHR